MFKLKITTTALSLSMLLGATTVQAMALAPRGSRPGPPAAAGAASDALPFGAGYEARRGAAGAESAATAEGPSSAGHGHGSSKGQGSGAGNGGRGSGAGRR